MLKTAKILEAIYAVRSNLPSVFKQIFSLWYAKLYGVLLVLINILNWAAVFYIDKKITDEEIALHYNVDFGIDYYGDISNLYIIPLLGMIFILFNIIMLGLLVQQKDKPFLLHLLLGTALVSNLILLMSIVALFLVNF